MSPISSPVLVWSMGVSKSPSDIARTLSDRRVMRLVRIRARATASSVTTSATMPSIMSVRFRNSRVATIASLMSCSSTNPKLDPANPAWSVKAITGFPESPGTPLA